MNAYRRLGDLLVHEGVITNLELTSAINAQRDSGQRLGSIFVERGYASEAEVAVCLARQLDLPMVDPTRITPEPQAAAFLNPEAALIHAVVPFRVDDSGVHVLLADPLELELTDAIARRSGRPVVLYVAPESALRAMADIWFGKVPTKRLQNDPKAPKKFTNIARISGDAHGTGFLATDEVLNRKVTLSAIKLNTANHDSYVSLLQWSTLVDSHLVAEVYDTRIQNRRRWTALSATRGESLSFLAGRGLARWGREILSSLHGIADLLDAQPCGFLSNENVFVRNTEFRIVPVSAPAPKDDVTAFSEIITACALIAGTDRAFLLEVADEIAQASNMSEAARILRARASHDVFGRNTDAERLILLDSATPEPEGGLVSGFRRFFGRSA